MTGRTRHSDQIALAHLSLVDMERVQWNVAYLRDSEDARLRAALFRDAVISYAKPFSGSNHSDGTGGLRVDSQHVPPELRDLHNEIVSLRNRLVAHTDMTYQRPEVSKREDDGVVGYSLTVTGYENLHFEHLLEPLTALAGAMHAALLRNRLDQADRRF